MYNNNYHTVLKKVAATILGITTRQIKSVKEDGDSYVVTLRSGDKHIISSKQWNRH